MKKSLQLIIIGATVVGLSACDAEYSNAQHSNADNQAALSSGNGNTHVGYYSPPPLRRVRARETFRDVGRRKSRWTAQNYRPKGKSHSKFGNS